MMLAPPILADTFTVTTLASSGAGSLSQAVADANNSPTDDVIVFQDGLSGTITLSGFQFDLGDAPSGNPGTLRIDGDRRITISGGQSTRVFEVRGGTSATLENLSVTGALTTADGGGVFCFGGTLTVNSVTFRNNQSLSGGGIHAEGGCMVTVVNSTFTGNTGTAEGGAIHVEDASLTLVNSTLVANTTNATATGGGLSVRDTQGNAISVDNSIISGNSEGDCVRFSGTIDTRHSLIGDGLDCVNGTGSDNLIGDPQLGGLTGDPEHFPLLSSSRAIDAGDDALLPLGISTDQLGATRINGGSVDMGAVESSFVPPLFRDGFESLTQR